ncbi:MAG TPA: hypothetical protein VH415_14120 [Nitrososphaeraceae archaeon]|jgi:hypothetical protein
MGELKDLRHGKGKGKGEDKGKGKWKRKVTNTMKQESQQDMTLGFKKQRIPVLMPSYYLRNKIIDHSM